MLKSAVKWFDRKKEFVFFESEDGQSIFVHKSSISSDNRKVLYKGDNLFFDIGTGKNGPKAVYILVRENGQRKTSHRD